MLCVQCGHENITGFEFCENCLSILSPSGAPLVAMVDVDDGPAPSPAPRDVSLFPWNPLGHRIDPLIGREKELAAAVGHVRGVIERWSARTVLLLGDRGVGTTTFVARFRELAHDVDHKLLSAEAYCREEPSRPYAAMGSVLRELLELPDDLDEASLGERFVERVTGLYLPEQRSAAIELAQLVGFLVGFRIAGTHFAEATETDTAATLVPRASQALMRLLVRLSKSSPVVIVLDEAHRAGAPLLGLIDLLMTGLANSPVLFLLVGRPKLISAAPGWERKQHIDMGPMSRADSETMLKALLAGLPKLATSKAVVDAILGWASGNPYAMRSVVRYLHQTGIIALEPGEAGWLLHVDMLEGLEIPRDLEGVASARLMQLDSSDREVLQQAAIAGPQFWLGMLVACARQGEDGATSVHGVGKDGTVDRLRTLLVSLVEREVVEPVRDRSVPGDDAYRFRLDVDRELLAAEMASPLRSRTHRVLAHWIELQSSQFGEDHQSLLARHYELAGDTSRAAQVYAMAARRARAGFATEDAAQLYEDALRLMARDDVTERLTALQALGELHLLIGQNAKALERLGEMLALSWSMRSRGRGATALNRMGRAYRAMGQYDEARAHLKGALQMYRAVSDERGGGDTLEDLGQLEWLRGDHDRAQKSFEVVKAIRTRQRDPRGLALSLHDLGCIFLERFDLDSAEKHLVDALALRRKLDDRVGVSMTLNNIGVVAWTRGDVPRAEGAWRESLDISREIGSRPVTAMLLSNLAESCLQDGRYDEAEVLLVEAQAITTETGDRRTLCSILMNVAALEMARGRSTSALETAGRAVTEAESLGGRRLLGLALVALGDIETGVARTDQTGAAADTAVEAGLSRIRDGIHALAGSNYALDHALALEQSADVLRRLDRSSEADVHAGEAAEAFAASGVRPPNRRAIAWGTARDFGAAMEAASGLSMETFGDPPWTEAPVANLPEDAKVPEDANAPEDAKVPEDANAPEAAPAAAAPTENPKPPKKKGGKGKSGKRR
ncbi:MAG: tetratricopeptide repeat protein [Myxococcales bacterium]|nr:tetratricopeptide repeat protein [Myxococcales bacterium]